MVPLSSAARAIIEAQPRIDGCDYVFAGRTGRTPFSGFSKAKSALDKATGAAGWTLHDLRRTAKTLMVRAGVRPTSLSASLVTSSPAWKSLRPALVS
jgi:integrase